MNLIQQLSKAYPDWRKYHSTPLEAAVEVGLLDESDLAADEVPELDFHDERVLEFDTEEQDYD